MPFTSSLVVVLVGKRKQPNYYYNFLFCDSDFVSEANRPTGFLQFIASVPNVHLCPTLHLPQVIAWLSFQDLFFNICNYLHADLFGEYATLSNTR